MAQEQMFCNQCEQTAKGVACRVKGVCGKEPDVAALQDLLIHTLKGISLFAHEGRSKGVIEERINRFTAEALFSTLTNVDFDPERFQVLIQKSVELRDELEKKVADAGGNVVFADPSVSFQPASSIRLSAPLK